MLNKNDKILVFFEDRSKVDGTDIADKSRWGDDGRIGDDDDDGDGWCDNNGNGRRDGGGGGGCDEDRRDGGGGGGCDEDGSEDEDGDGGWDDDGDDTADDGDFDDNCGGEDVFGDGDGSDGYIRGDTDGNVTDSRVGGLWMYQQGSHLDLAGILGTNVGRGVGEDGIDGESENGGGSWWCEDRRGKSQ